MSVRSVGSPKPPATTAPAKAATEKTPVTYDRRAEREWDLAPPARGWGNRGVERRELSRYPDDLTGAPDDVRAFTKAEWMAHRVPQLQAKDESSIPDWRR